MALFGNQIGIIPAREITIRFSSARPTTPIPIHTCRSEDSSWRKSRTPRIDKSWSCSMMDAFISTILLQRGELNHFDTGVAGYYGLTALTVSDLNGDCLAELILTNESDLFVFNAAGQLLWQVAGAGGYDVVAGQMDNDPAIEIATTSGYVVDASTHSVQWTHNGGFGSHLKLAPFPGENYQQLIEAEGWQFVYSYDVARQLPRWSIQTPQDIGAIDVADVDNDGTPEVIIGDGQWGNVHVHDLITQTLKWEVNNPEHGVTNIAIGDVD